jgi:hypothetical protein
MATLADIKTKVENAITSGRCTITKQMVDSKSFTYVLALLRSQQIEFSDLKPGDVTLAGLTLTITGKATILRRADKVTKITLQDVGANQRACVVEVAAFGECQPDQLVKNELPDLEELFKPPKPTGASFPPLGLSYTRSRLEASSTKETLTITGDAPTIANQSIQILDKPRIELSQLGFVLESSLPFGTTTPDARFRTTGTFTIENKETAQNIEVVAAVDLPIGRTIRSGRWRVTGSSAAGLTLDDVRGWVGAERMFNAAPSQIIGLDGFSLKSIAVDFVITGQEKKINSIQVVVSTDNKWENFVTGLSLSNITVVVNVTPPFNSPSIFASVGAELSLLNVPKLYASMTFSTDSGEWAISFSPADSLLLSAISALVGGEDLTKLGFDNPNAIRLNLQELTFVLNLKSGVKLQSIEFVGVMEELSWKLLGDTLEVSSAELSLDIIDPFGGPTKHIDLTLSGTLIFLGTVQVSFEMARIEGRWAMSAVVIDTPREEVVPEDPASQAQQVKLSALTTKLDIGLHEQLVRYANRPLTGLSMRYTTPAKDLPAEFSFNATISELLEFSLGDFLIKIPSLSVEFNKAQQISMTLKATIRLPQFKNAEMALVFAYQQPQGWTIMVEALGLRGVYDSNAKLVKIGFGSVTFGQLMQTIYSLVEPGRTIRLPEPWNVLEGISLDGAEFFLYFDKPQGGADSPRFGLSYTFTPEADLVFGTLKKIGFNYMKSGKLKLSVEGSIGIVGSRRPLKAEWDPRNPNAAPPVPLRSGSFIDLQFLALGQRLQLNRAQNIQRVSEAITRMSEAFNGERPNLFGGPDPVLSFNAQSGLLIAADFWLLETLSMKLVFNDGIIAGVSIGLSGDRARYLRGLDFEILYKKVSEGLGVYQVELRVPDAIRQIELGQVSITIPIVALEIYTNGNFRVDLGFPKNNDFSRSFQLQVFPFIGSGGFYFGRLGGATTKRLPRDSIYKPEAFDPVLVFGIGLRIGVGKSIQRGIFDAELSLCYEGILEGVLAFFNPEKSAPESLYYWIQGTVGIVGLIRGRVSFAVITAEVSLEIAARVGVTLESFQPLILSFKASVSINLVVRIGTGWLGVDINCSFYAEISEQFTIPVRNPGLPAWTMAPANRAQRTPQAPAPFGLMAQSEGRVEEALLSLVSFGLADPALQELPPPADALQRADLTPQASQPIPRMTWNHIELPDRERGDLRLLFRPQFTMAGVGNEQIAHGVALLFLQSVGTANPIVNSAGDQPNIPSDFDRFAEAMLLWCINSLLNRDQIATSKAEVLNLLISAEDLRGIYRVLTRSKRGAAPFTAAEVVDFLKHYFQIKIQVEKRPEGGVNDPSSYQTARPEVAIFPMIPELRLEVTFTRKFPGKEAFLQPHHVVKFDRQTVVPLGYHEEILKHFEELDSEFRTEVEKDVDRTTTDPELQELPPAGGRSIAEFVFEDYFLLIARDVVQSSLDVLKAYLQSQKTGANDTIADLASRYRGVINNIANDHSGALISPGVEIQIGGGTTITVEGSTFADIAGSYGQQPDGPLVYELGRANAFVPGLLNAGNIIMVGELQREITEFDTLQSVSEAMNLDGPGELAMEIAIVPGYLNPDVRLLVPIGLRLRQTAAPQTTGDGETVAKLAAFYTGVEDPDAEVNRQFVKDLGALNAYLDGLLREGADLAIPGGNVHFVAPGDTLASIAVNTGLDITPMDILEFNLTRDDIFNGGVELEIPPTMVNAEEGDTLESVALQQGVTVSMVADSNAATPGFLVPGQTVLVRSIKVKDLIGNLLTKRPFPNSDIERNRFDQTAGMASRFLLPGIRLPRPTYLPNDLYKMWIKDNPLPLYWLTGQQFQLPLFSRSKEIIALGLAAQGGQPLREFDDTYLQCDIQLKFPEEADMPLWYEAAMPGFRAEQNKDATGVLLSLVQDEFEWIESVRLARLNARADKFSKLPISAFAPRRFPLGSRIQLMGPQPVFTFGNGAGAANPTIWAFPEGLRQIISRPGPPLAFRLDKGLEAIGNDPGNFPLVRPCSWATALTMTIRRVTFSDEDATLPVYEIDGVDSEGLLLLDDILRHGSSVRDVRIYYPSKVDDLPALVNAPGFIVQTNLATLTGLQLGGSITPEGVPEQVQLLELLRKVWLASIARSGGCYLCYSNAGLPGEVFNDDGVGQVTILVTFGFKDDQIFPFVNRAVVGEVTTADSKLFATSVGRSRRITLSPAPTVNEFLDQYRVSIGDLENALATRPLKAGAIKYYAWKLEPGTGEWKTDVRTHTISQGQTLGDIVVALNIPQANLYVNVKAAELLAINANNPALLNLVNESNFELTEQLFVKQPKLPPGHVGFVVRRKRPVEPMPGQLLPVIYPPAEQQLEYLYSLLGCRVAKNQEFFQSIEVPADGPEAPVIPEDILGLDEFGRNILAWRYTKVIPARKFLSGGPEVPSGHDPLLPHPGRNPYRGTGKRLPVRFEWFDGFGNKTLSPFNRGEDQTVYPLSIGYTDELMGVERWPAVSAGYSVRPKENDITKQEIYVQFDFDTSRYEGRGNVLRTPGDAKKAARADLEAFRRIYYQLTWGITEVLLYTTLDDQGSAANNAQDRIDKQAVVDFITRIIAYLVTVVRSKPKELPASGQVIRQTVMRQVTLSNSEELFPLVVRLEIRRQDPVDEEFLDMPGVRSVSHEIEPLAVVGSSDEEEESGSISEFASQFEQVFQNTKLATGLGRASDVETDSRNRLWVVRTDFENGISCTIQPDQQHFFAPVPLATTLLSDPTLKVYDYVEYPTDGGKRHRLQETTASYGGIDLDEYARRFVSAIDTVLLPQYAVPAYMLEKQRYSTILEAKLTIANEIAESVDRVDAGGGGDLAQAQELLRQRMLVQLSAAYEVDTIVQIGVGMRSPYKLLENEQPGDNPSKVFESLEDLPKFFGQPVAELPGGSTEEVDFTVSTAKIPLEDGQSYLTFLFDSKKAMPEQVLEVGLSYEVASMEHEISEAPGLPASRASSWLTFINPMEIIPQDLPIIVRIPVPIRAYPIPPTLDKQSVMPAHDPDDPNLKLEETRQYSYSYDYRRLGPVSDLVYTSPRFNAKLSKVEEGDPDNEMDLFQALVSFDRVWDQLSSDLYTLPDLFDPLGEDVDRDRVLDALAAFAQIASMVANSWGDWPTVRDKVYVSPEEPGADAYLYVINESGQDQEDTPWEVIVRKCKDADPYGDTPIPSIEIEGWELMEIPNGNPDERRFRYWDVDGFLTGREAKNISTRTVVFEKLDILHNQNAWAGVRMTRNENLFGDRACIEIHPRTNPKFIYQTPMVRFPEILTPLLKYDAEIDIARIPAKPGGTQDEMVKKPLEGHLARLFGRFFESVAKNLDEEMTDERRIQLTCRYRYDLDHPPYGFGDVGDADSLPVTLPIVMAPPFNFTVRTDYMTCVNNSNSFLCKLSEAIKVWFGRRYPSKNNGRFIFEISVYSTLGDGGKLPIYRMNNLALILDEVSDLKEGS